MKVKKNVFFTAATSVACIILFCLLFNNTVIVKNSYSPRFIPPLQGIEGTTIRSTTPNITDTKNKPSITTSSVTTESKSTSIPPKTTTTSPVITTKQPPVTTQSAITTQPPITTARSVISSTQKVLSTTKSPVTSQSTITSTKSTITSTQSAITTTKSISTTIKKPSPFICYKNPENLPTLPNIETRPPEKGKSIFFLETSCRHKLDGKVKLTIRQACCVESAALMNPNWQIHLLITSPATIKNTSDVSDKIMNSLLSYKNLKISHVDIDKYFAGTPVEQLFKSGLMETSRSPVVHLSDVLRFVTMWKYGITYLDMDVVVMKKFEDLEPNFTGLEWDGSIASGVMNFAPDGKGHEWVEAILKDINADFRPKEWSYNANGALSRLLHKVCNTTLTAQMTKERCQGFTIHPRPVFYPLFPWHWPIFFNKTRLSESLAQLSNSRAVHMWNAMSGGGRLVAGENSAYEVVAMEFCPKVYAQIPKGSPFRRR